MSTIHPKKVSHLQDAIPIPSEYLCVDNAHPKRVTIQNIVDFEVNWFAKKRVFVIAKLSVWAFSSVEYALLWVVLRGSRGWSSAGVVARRLTTAGCACGRWAACFRPPVPEVTPTADMRPKHRCPVDINDDPNKMLSDTSMYMQTCCTNNEVTVVMVWKTNNTRRTSRKNRQKVWLTKAAGPGQSIR